MPSLQALRDRLALRQDQLSACWCSVYVAWRSMEALTWGSTFRAEWNKQLAMFYRLLTPRRYDMPNTLQAPI